MFPGHDAGCPEGDDKVNVGCMGGWHGAGWPGGPVNELDEHGEPGRTTESGRRCR